MAPIRVIVHGALGKVGREIVRALTLDVDTQLVGAVDVAAAGGGLSLPDESGEVPLSTDVNAIIDTCRPEVLVDFTVAAAVMPMVRIATGKGIHLVIGTTGLSADNLDEIGRLAKDNEVGAVVAPNFALGAVLMMHLAQVAGRYFDYAEIIELHHDQKADAPSGTARATARGMLENRGKPFSLPRQKQPFPSRGEQMDGISLHSVRLPGLLAHQEVLLGGQGQTLSIRHDTISRECFMPGILMAVKEVQKHRGLVYGLDKLLAL